MSDNCWFGQQKQSVEDLCFEMNEFLSTADGSSFNVCAHLYEIILKGENERQTELFEKAVVLYEYIESNNSVTVPVSEYEEQKSTLKSEYGELVNTFIDFFVRQKSTSTVFYQNMWNTVQNDMFFPDYGAKVFAFYYILIDRRIPYFELTDGYMMENDAFKRLRREYAEQICKIRYILSAGMKQKTERASLVLKELGIDCPGSDVTGEALAEYEKKLIMMVEVLKGKDQSSVANLGGLLGKLRELAD